MAIQQASELAQNLQDFIKSARLDLERVIMNPSFCEEQKAQYLDSLGSKVQGYTDKFLLLLP